MKAEESLRERLRRRGIAIASVLALFSGSSASDAITVELQHLPAPASSAALPLLAASVGTAAIGIAAVAFAFRHAPEEIGPETSPAPIPSETSVKPVDQVTLQEAIAAVCKGDLARLRELLKANPGLARARVEGIPNDHYTAYFHEATLLHHIATNPLPDKVVPNVLEIAKALIDAGAEVDAITHPPDGTPGWTTLALITSTADELIGDLREPLVDLLLKSGADIDAQAGQALEGALYYYSASSIQILLKRHPTLDLRLAAGVGDIKRVREFFAADGKLVAGVARLGSEPAKTAEARAELLDEALSYACMGPSGGDAEVVRFLVDHGARATRWFWGRTALHGAAAGGNLDVVKAVVEAGGDPTVQDPFYHSTPAGWAAHFKHDEVAAWLREKEREAEAKTGSDF